MSGRPLTDVDSFDDPVIVLADGESLNSANIGRGDQSLANRTRNLKNRLDAQHGAIVGASTVKGAGFSTSSTSGVDVTGAVIGLTGAIAGDILEIEASVAIRSDGASNADVSLVAIDGAATDDEFSTSYGGYARTASGSTIQGVCLIKTHPILTGGTVIAKLRALNVSGGSSVTYVDRWTLRARLIRP